MCFQSGFAGTVDRSKRIDRKEKHRLINNGSDASGVQGSESACASV